MDQPSALNLEMDSSAAPTPSEGMSSPKSMPPTAATSTHTPDSPTDSGPRQYPIPSASEPMQYRAIGLIRGVYTPSDEQFTRGNLVTDDGVTIDAVLLGRVMSLVKKHLELDKPHLWVVYPRTREKQYDLHAQILGVWEPENLSKHPVDDTEADDTGNLDQSDITDDLDVDDPDAEADLGEEALTTPEADEAANETADLADTEEEESSDAAAVETVATPVAIALNKPMRPLPPPPPEAPPAPTPEAAPPPELDHDDGYFSIRGEVLFYSEEEDRLIVRIQQAPKKPDQPPKAFKLILDGKLQGKTVGYFWDFQVRRNGNHLVIKDSTVIGLVPPRKRDKAESGGFRKGPPPKKPWKRRQPGEGAPAPRTSSTTKPREGIGRPVKRSNHPPQESKPEE